MKIQTRSCSTEPALRRRWQIFLNAALVNVKTQDLGRQESILANVVGELKDFDATEEKGFFGFFKNRQRRWKL